MDVSTDCRFSLATLAGRTITALTHADELAALLPVINAGGAFALIDRDPEANGSNLPFLTGCVVAMFSQPAPVQATTGRVPGTGRGGNGRFRSNFATRGLTVPLDVAGLEAVIDRCRAQLSAA